MIGPVPICLECVHYHHDYDLEEPMKCDAFPQGIPFEIIIGSFDHHNPRPDDNGIQFEEMNRG